MIFESFWPRIYKENFFSDAQIGKNPITHTLILSLACASFAKRFWKPSFTLSYWWHGMCSSTSGPLCAIVQWTEAQNDSTTVLNTLQAEVNRRRIQLVQSMSLARSTEAALIQKRRNLLLTMAQSGLGDEQTAEMIQKFDEATRADLPKWRTKRYARDLLFNMRPLDFWPIRNIIVSK